jgi:catechol 1,2-dioxygenase
MSDVRLVTIINDLEKTLLDFVQRHQITHHEYRVATDVLVAGAQAGHGAILLDILLEAETLDVESSHRKGSPLGLLGPFYLPGAPRLSPPNVMPQRPDEKGRKLVFRGHVRSTSGAALPDAEFDMWQADADGDYSGIVPGIPDWNLRGRFGAAPDGGFEVTTIQPSPYGVPGDGPIGAMLRALGRDLFRPAHLHLMVTAPGHEVLTSQLFFPGGDYHAGDASNAVRDGLLTAIEYTDDAVIATYDFVLEPLPAE